MSVWGYPVTRTWRINKLEGQQSSQLCGGDYGSGDWFKVAPWCGAESGEDGLFDGYLPRQRGFSRAEGLRTDGGSGLLCGTLPLVGVISVLGWGR